MEAAPGKAPETAADPRGKRLGRPLAARALAVGVFAASACLTALALRSLLPVPLEAFQAAKMEHLERHRDEVDVVFLGSSRVLRHLVPQEFDRVLADRNLADRGRPRRSFNLGMPAMRELEATALLHWLAGLRPARLRWVFLECEANPTQLEEANVLARRTVFWHRPAVGALALRQIAASEEGLGEKIGLGRRHLLATAANAANLGRGEVWIRSWTGPRRARRQPWVLGTHEDGYVSLNQAMVRERRRRGGGDVTERRERFLANLDGYERQLERLRREGPRSGTASEADVELLGRVQELATSLGFEPIFLSGPRLDPRPELLEAQERGLVRNLFFYSDPHRHPQLYAAGHRFDVEHLNASGARLYTRLVAERFAGHLDTGHLDAVERAP